MLFNWLLLKSVFFYGNFAWCHPLIFHFCDLFWILARMNPLDKNRDPYKLKSSNQYPRSWRRQAWGLAFLHPTEPRILIWILPLDNPSAKTQRHHYSFFLWHHVYRILHHDLLYFFHFFLSLFIYQTFLFWKMIINIYFPRTSIL